MTHGILFILFVLALVMSLRTYKWENSFVLNFFVYSIIPFGFILIEKQLWKDSVNKLI